MDTLKKDTVTPRAVLRYTPTDDSIDNALDEDYWGASPCGYLYLGTPRTLQMSATVDF